MLARRNRPTRPKARLFFLVPKTTPRVTPPQAARPAPRRGRRHRPGFRTWQSLMPTSPRAVLSNSSLSFQVFDRIENLCRRGKTTLFLPPTGDDASFSNKCRQLRRPYSSDKRTRTCSAALELSCVPAKLSISRRVLRSIVDRAAPAFFESSRADNAPKLNRDLI